ncbi:MAG: flagellar motor switch phosphatase FliY [Oscillospiraceae bacterium]|jgi:flagellar motor switch protein FliN/FliY|nr:flagellar motor switch phosphatase FliY [Oscillospiraceae bacterium]
MSKAIEISEIQKDAIGEIMNIGMGSAATAASELLNAKVWITTPKVSVQKAAEMRADELEPAICVKIVYVKGITGSNLMLLKQDDVQMILNQLMGQPLEVTPDFEFDELNISAVSEVMNQMMGSCATALSKFLDMSIDISTPTPHVMDKINISDLQDYEPGDTVVAINFDLTVENVIKSEFVSVMSLELASELADRLLTLNEEVKHEEEKAAAEAAASKSQPNQASPSAPQGAPAQYAPPPMPAFDPAAMQGQTPYGYPPLPPQGMPAMGMPGGYAPPPPQGMPYGYYPPYGFPPGMMPINIQSAQLHQFENFDVNLSGEQKDNLQLLMGVPLQISVEIGTARRRVKEILEFTQGTIIELERQAGAPVDVVVNGNLIARGDVVVIDDNFAVRITEIIKSKFMDSLGKE